MDVLGGANHRAAQFRIGVIIAASEILQHTLNTSHPYERLSDFFVMFISHNVNSVALNSSNVKRQN
jgi:hypothetical protein